MIQSVPTEDYLEKEGKKKKKSTFWEAAGSGSLPQQLEILA